MSEETSDKSGGLLLLRLAFWNKPEALEAPKPSAQFMGVEVPPEMQQGWSFGGRRAPRISRAEALQVPAVKRARDLTAGTLGSLPVHFYDKDRRKTDISPNLLDQIDERDVTNVVTLAGTFEDMLFESMSYWLVTQFGAHLKPSHAQHLEYSRVSQIEDSAGNPIFYVDGRRVSSELIIQFPSPNPPLLVHAARAIRTCLLLDRTAALYTDDPLPLSYFAPKGEIDPMDRAETQKMLDEWHAARQMRATGYVPAALELKSLQFTAEQIQLADQRQHAVLEIARATGIDPEDLGVSTTSRTYQNAEQRRLDLLDFTLMPYVKALEQRLSMNDVSPRGTYAKVSMDGFLRSDTKTRMDAYAVGQPLGAYTTDEIRELEDKPALTAAEKAEIAPKPPVQPQLQPVSQNGNRPQEVANAR